SDAGDLLGKALFTVGVSTQQRTPIVNDTRVRGDRVGQVLASGSYWFPARMDLDTMLNKIDSRLVDNLYVIKGPYSARYGPAFDFIDIQLLQSPRYSSNEIFGSTSATYKTNGEQLYGRQNVWGGGPSSGYYLSYGHSLGNDYVDGSGVGLPSSFHSRDVFATMGWDLSLYQNLEFTYLRLDQTGLEFPGLVFDINVLVTNGFEVVYEDQDPLLGDYFQVEGWHNRTKFSGDTLGQGINRQLPGIKTILYSPDGLSGAAITNADSSSSGYRMDTTWYDDLGHSVTLGSDLTHLQQQLNDIEVFLPPNDNNFPIPPSFMTDVGLFAESSQEIGDRFVFRSGGRLDYVYTGADDFVPGVPLPLSVILDADLPQDFWLWSAYLSGEYRWDANWTSSFAAGIAQRPPTLTELYATAPFIGTIQQGLTFVGGDPLLKPERIRQFDLGLRYETRDVRARVSAFNAWIEDYITYDLTAPADPEGGLSTGVLFTNTQLARFNGFEVATEWDLLPYLLGYANVSLVEGHDRTRERGARGVPGPRSGVPGNSREPLPGIPPLFATLGLRFYDGSSNPHWWTDLQARVVDDQSRNAATLAELPTPGFTVWNLRTFLQVTPSMVIVTGIENLTDKFYFEHLDYRAGLGVFRPGISYYFGTEVSY
ncbi:MAG: TonB-dependent receptor, partial [Planctomycetales bacterium]|nr:TonB-dependent receptor [Planctomycetales bacterium]